MSEVICLDDKKSGRVSVAEHQRLGKINAMTRTFRLIMGH